MPTLPRLRLLRERQFLTQKVLAAKAGISKVTITRAENGESVQFASILKLADALQVDPSELVEERSTNDK